ncbi:lipase maturation factor family protein [Candidatus Uhrbacteria bacterium]|nr:lipase maturation factor family protein [Candidatus Uhrbacteria bacterium]
MQPTFLFDGECGFCRHWVTYWKKMVGTRVTFVTLQESHRDLTTALFIGPDGVEYQGARAVAELLLFAPGKGWFRWMYVHLYPFALASDWFYKRVASCRTCGARATHLLWGKNLEPSTFLFTRRLFLRLLGLVYLIAFLSFYVQIPGLIGEHGLLPVGEYLASAKTVLGNSAYFHIPSLAWISSSSSFLGFLSILGAVLAALAVIGIQLTPIFFLLWMLYLSLFYAGQTFMGFQWDIFLLEAGFLAIFFAPTRFGDKHDAPHVVVWLYRLLVFRLMFFSGFVKLASGDPTWANLSALDYHYWTQPLPNTISWFVNQLPTWVDHVSMLFMFFVQLVLPFFIFAPRRLRFLAAFGFIVLELMIGITGNYTFFNLLTIACVVLMFDDQFFRRLPKRAVPIASHTQRRAAQVLTGVIVFLLLFNLPTPLRIVNSYGLFAVMTTSRHEIILQGSNDGERWLDYEFKYKPGDVNRAPPFVAPHQPRLDWQMWFAALTPYQENPWFTNLAEALLRSTPEVLDLLLSDPFEGDPPKYVRGALYGYRFTTSDEREETGAWWVREPLGLYLPVASLEHK